MQPTVERFRALARSSPWRWRTLHFTRNDERGALEAWVRRPGELLVRREGERDHYVHEGLEHPGGGSFVVFSSPDADLVPPPRPPRVWPQDVPTVLDADGLVAERPDDWNIEYGDPMYENYTWVAMLDPVELSHDVLVDDVVADDLDGRPVLRARVRPTDDYEPRCTCCSLLPTRRILMAEFDNYPEGLARIEETDFPDAFDVALDVRTGVVVELDPIGGDGSHLMFSVDIHDVDEDVDGMFLLHRR